MYPSNCPYYSMSSPYCWYCMPSYRMAPYSMPPWDMEPDPNMITNPDLSREMPDQGKKSKSGFTTEEALRIGRRLGIDWNKNKFDVEQFRVGLNTELEHGRRDPSTNVTNDDPLLTGKIALAHLNEFPDYYTRLTKLEQEAKAYWGMK